MIKNVIFDLGRVIYSYWPYDDMISLGFSETQATNINKNVFENSLWVEQLDRGIYTVREGMENFCEKFPDLAEDIRKITVDGLEVWWDRLMTIMPESLEFYYDVKRRGFGVYILTNFAEDSFAHMRNRDSFFNEADGIVVSAHEKLIKPEAAIYQCILNRYNLVPEETIFIDDSAANIAAAKAQGIHGIVFTNIEDCKKQFERLCAEIS